MDRRKFLLASCAAGVTGLAQTSASKKRPNILLMFSDDHAYQAISAYGHKLNQTPNLDRLAKEGMLFTSALVTNSICAPSRAVMLTGKYSHLNGVLDNVMEFNPAQQTFPKLLQAAGYQTAMIGKWHLKSDPTGFDHWEVLPGQGNYYNPDFITKEGRHRREGYVTDVVADLAMEWLEKRDKTKPFMLFFQQKAPHRNWMPGPKHLTDYEDHHFPEPATLYDDYKNRASPASKQAMEIGKDMVMNADLKVVSGDQAGGEGGGFRAEYNRMNAQQKAAWDAAYKRRGDDFQRLKPEGRDLTGWKYQQYMKDYLRCVASVDDNAGRVMKYLDDNKLTDNTLVVYMSDQGFYLGEHGWFDKRWIYEESIRTPLLMRWPGVVKPGSKTDLMVANVDMAQTFLEAAGVPEPTDMQGRSIVPILKGQKPADWRKAFYFHYYELPVHQVARHEGVRTDRYTLAHFYDTDEWELFDRQKDPNQMVSIYGKPEYAKIEAGLKADLARLKAELKVPPPPPVVPAKKPGRAKPAAQ
ncbi:MAG: sulfatase [Bryobacteraceae bacterium]|nr:sulfatase [Bryobacteraceae bacterium]